MTDMLPELHVGMCCHADWLIYHFFAALTFAHHEVLPVSLVVTADALQIVIQSTEGETLRHVCKWLQLIIKTVGMPGGHIAGVKWRVVLSKALQRAYA